MVVLFIGVPGNVVHEGSLFGLKMHIHEEKESIASSMNNIEMDRDMP